MVGEYILEVLILVVFAYLLADIIIAHKSATQKLNDKIEEQEKIIESLKKSKQNFVSINKALVYKCKELEKELEQYNKKDPNKKVYSNPFAAVEGYLNGDVDEKDIRNQMQ